MGLASTCAGAGLESWCFWNRLYAHSQRSSPLCTASEHSFCALRSYVDSLFFTCTIPMLSKVCIFGPLYSRPTTFPEVFCSCLHTVDCCVNRMLPSGSISAPEEGRSARVKGTTRPPSWSAVSGKGRGVAWVMAPPEMAFSGGVKAFPAAARPCSARSFRPLFAARFSAEQG